jgi:hypothetical protein
MPQKFHRRTEGYKKLIRGLLQSETRLRIAKSGKTIKQQKEGRVSAPSISDVSQFIFPPPLDDYEEFKRDTRHKQAAAAPAAAPAAPASHSVNFVDVPEESQTKNTTDADHFLELAQEGERETFANKYYVPPVRSMFRSRPDDEEVEVVVPTRTTTTRTTRLAARRPKSAAPTRRVQYRPTLRGHKKSSTKKTSSGSTQQRPFSAAPRPRSRPSRANGNHTTATDNTLKRSAASPRPATASTTRSSIKNNQNNQNNHDHELREEVQVQQPTVTMTQRLDKKRPKSATVRRKINQRKLVQNKESQILDMRLQHDLDKQRLSLYTKQRDRRTHFLQEQNQKQKQSQIHLFVENQQHEVEKIKGANHTSRQLYQNRVLTLSMHHKSVKKTHDEVYTKVLDTILLSQKQGDRTNLSLPEIRFLEHLKALIKHDAGSSFDWTPSILAMLNHMKEYSDPSDFRNPFFVCGMVSLIECSGFGINKYKSWCRKKHMSLPPCEDVSSALRLSKEHAVLVESGELWLAEHTFVHDTWTHVKD